MKEIHLGIGVVKETDPLAGVEFLGEVPTSGFVTGNALASAIGLSDGYTQYSNEPWLKFSLGGKTLYVAKKTFRYRVSWDHINAVGAVYGTRTVTVQGDTYKVRLLKGGARDPISGSGWDPEQSWGSEWNRLFYPLIPNPSNVPTHPVSQEGIRYGAFANYTEADLGVSSGNGRATWCQETSAIFVRQRVARGGSGLSSFGLGNSSTTHTDYGWRPVLELIGT